MNGKIYDIGIIGAGPCGIACAIHAAKKHMSVLVVECGNDFNKRYCSVDNGLECRNCFTCNVVSGFGGCVHCGDSAKLSCYPSGEALFEKLENDYERILEEACLLWDVNRDLDFQDRTIVCGDHSLNIKPYPVCVIRSKKIEDRLKYFWNELELRKVNYCKGSMSSFEKRKDYFSLRLDDGRRFNCKKMVLAIGRWGIRWIKDNLSRMGIEHKSPTSSIGARIEMPVRYLRKVGDLCPDFKVRANKNGIEYKTFCFCCGSSGGRLKSWKYGSYHLLDGHILTSDDSISEYGNFALLRQIVKPIDYAGDYDDYIVSLLKLYDEISEGKPIFQNYKSFKRHDMGCSENKISMKYAQPGLLHELIFPNKDYCEIADAILEILAQQASVGIGELMDEAKIVGLELEGLWDRIITNQNFMSNIDGLYFGGDCAGETQGILQATMSGIRIAEACNGQL